MKVGVVGNPRYGGPRRRPGAAAIAAPDRGITLYTSPASSRSGPRRSRPSSRSTRRAGHVRRRRHAAARRPPARRPRNPILGVNLGRLGFLTTRRARTLEARARCAGGRELPGRAAQTLGCHPRRGDETRSTQIALNDVVLHKGGVARVIRVNVSAHGETSARTPPMASSSPRRPAPPRTVSLPAARRGAGRRVHHHHADLGAYPRDAAPRRSRRPPDRDRADRRMARGAAGDGRRPGRHHVRRGETLVVRRADHRVS